MVQSPPWKCLQLQHGAALHQLDFVQPSETRFGFQNSQKASEASRTVQQAKHFPCKPGDLSLTPRTHVIMEVVNQLQKSCPPISTQSYMLCNTSPYTYNNNKPIGIKRFRSIER